MPVEVILPRVDMGMQSGVITQWYVNEGEKVEGGTKLFEIETDKAAMDIEAPASGFVHHIFDSELKLIPVGTAVAFIYSEGEQVTAPPPRNTVSAADLEVVALEKNYCLLPQAPRNSGRGQRATPLARRLARERGIALARLGGSGPRGRIHAEDVEQAREANRSLSSAQEQGFTIIPVDGMRRTIAERLTLSKQTIPHFYLTSTCTLDKLLAARAAFNTGTQKISVNDLIIKAWALAMQRVPRANVTWHDTEIHQYDTSDVGIAIAVEGGLFTPVIRRAETKTIVEISGEVKELAAKAHARKLAPADYQGGSTAISNLGMYGVEEFSAIINPPHATILAVGAATEEFVPVHGQPVLMTRMRCTLSCDHRAVDGAIGAELLRAFRNLIEDPSMLLA